MFSSQKNLFVCEGTIFTDHVSFIFWLIFFFQCMLLLSWFTTIFFRWIYHQYLAMVMVLISVIVLAIRWAEIELDAQIISVLETCILGPHVMIRPPSCYRVIFLLLRPMVGLIGFTVKWFGWLNGYCYLHLEACRWYWILMIHGSKYYIAVVY